MKRDLISFEEEIEVSIYSESSQEAIYELQELDKDLNVLIDLCEKDIDKDASVSYKRYVGEYNRILKRLQELNSKFKSFELINVELEAGDLTPLPPFEQAKLKEIINDSRKLIHRIQKIVGKEINEMDIIKKLEIIFSSFHSIVHQLKDRYKNRETLTVKDEYDVHDLLHTILKIFFEDIRPEEPTPSVAGGHRKMDFLLKTEKTVIEVKMTRKNLSTNELSKQLHDDIATYKKHQDCNILICLFTTLMVELRILKALKMILLTIQPMISRF